MAANYSQYTDHNEIGGVSVGLEDAKLAAADSVDEVTATDCVLMKDASGNPVKILKEDFNEAVRDALGSILSYNGLGTAIGKVAALGSSDNDFGSISTSDLASVLGVGKVKGFEFYWASGHASWTDNEDSTGYWQLTYGDSIPIIIRVGTDNYDVISGDITSLPSAFGLSVSESKLHGGMSSSFNGIILLLKLGSVS